MRELKRLPEEKMAQELLQVRNTSAVWMKKSQGVQGTLRGKKENVQAHPSPVQKSAVPRSCVRADGSTQLNRRNWQGTHRAQCSLWQVLLGRCLKCSIARPWCNFKIHNQRPSDCPHAVCPAQEEKDMCHHTQYLRRDLDLTVTMEFWVYIASNNERFPSFASCSRVLLVWRHHNGEAWEQIIRTVVSA